MPLSEALQRGFHPEEEHARAAALRLPPDCVLVYAPPGAGKSLQAEALRRMFGCRLTVDGWDGVAPVPVGALVLTNCMPTAFGATSDGRNG